MKTTITEVSARQILDSRGTPTVEAEIILSDGTVGIASVPSGSSKGKREAVEKRDNDMVVYRGLGVLHAVDNIKNIIGPKIKGMDAHDQEEVDQAMIDLDGTPTKEKLGANAILAVSLAIARSCARSNGEPLFQYLTTLSPALSQRVGLEFHLPVLHLNVINGGMHADSPLSIQEFLIIPFGFEKFSDSLRAGVEIYWLVRDVLKIQNLGINTGDEGGFAPNIAKTGQAIEVIVEAVKRSGYKIGEQIYIGLDIAATHLSTGQGRYNMDGEQYDTGNLVYFYKNLMTTYPFLKSIEDPFGQDDWMGFKNLNKEMNNQVQVVTDDLTVTNPGIFTKAILEQVGNTILVKYNQVGTLTETLKVMKMAKDSGWKMILGNRSAETVDDFESDLAVAFHMNQVKFGAPSRGERLSKYNRLLEIENLLGSQAKFPGRSAFSF